MPYVKGVGYVPVSRPTEEAAKAEHLDALRRLASELGHTPTTEELSRCSYAPSYWKYCKLFGSMPEAHRCAGLTPSKRGGDRGGVKAEDRDFFDNRRAAMVALFRDGATLEEIATTYRLTRERVRQLIRAAGYADNPSRIDPIRILASARSASSIWEVCQETGKSAELISQCLHELGHLSSLQRLWKWRKRRGKRKNRKYTELDLLTRLRSLAVKVGHTPGMSEINAEPVFPRHTLYVLRFGSITKAQRLAGLKPNRTGKPPSELPLSLKLPKQ